LFTYDIETLQKIDTQFISLSATATRLSPEYYLIRDNIATQLKIYSIESNDFVGVINPVKGLVDVIPFGYKGDTDIIEYYAFKANDTTVTFVDIKTNV